MPAAPMAAMPLPPPVTSSLDLIGNTPLLEVQGLDAGKCRLFLKLENQNPTGSIKDRIALSIIEAAERDGRLQPGGTIVEATAGNTGLALTLVGARKGYKVLLVIPDKMSREKVQQVRAMGAEVRLTRSDVGRGHPEYYMDLAERLAGEIEGGFHADQFANPANPLAHEKSTGPEIWAQMGHDVDAVCCGVGSGGTLTGLGRYFQRTAPGTQMILADPVGSVLAGLAEGRGPSPKGSYTVEGIGQDFVPDNADLDLVSRAYSIPDREAIDTVRDLLKATGVLAGSSSGTLIAAALRWCREQTEPKRVVTFVCDTGAKYLSKVYNDSWLTAQGFARRQLHGDLRDLVASRPSEGALVTAGPDDTLLTAYNRMRAADVSQLPVMDDSGRLLGILDDTDIVHVMDTDEISRGERFAKPVRDAMATNLHTVQVRERIESLVPVFDAGEVAIVYDGDEFVGLITPVDLINFLRLNA